MILQTGGSACSAITTTSSPSARAFAMADGGSTTPSWAPSEPISRTCWKRRMNSLMGEFFVGGTRGPPLKNARVISSLGLGALVFRRQELDHFLHARGRLTERRGELGGSGRRPARALEGGADAVAKLLVTIRYPCAPAHQGKDGALAF